MLSVELHDKATVSSFIKDSRGFLRLNAKFSKVGIQRYTARELGLQGRPPGDILRVFRPEEEVFAQDSLDSFENVPVTNDHPPENVTASNVTKYGVGITLGKRTRDGDYTAGTLLLQDAQAVADYEAGKVELSDGYSCEIKLEAGTWKGQAYDATKQNIRGNHTALVGAGRCGGACRITDGQTVCDECGGHEAASCSCHESETEMTTTPAASPQLVQRVVDGITVEVTAQGAQVIDKLQAQLSDAANAKTSVQTLLDAEVAAHKTTKETLEGKVTGLETQVTDAALDARVSERAGLISTVSKVLGKDYNPAGKSSVQLMTDAVAKVYGDEAAKERSEDYIKGLFATVSAQADKQADPIQSSVRDSMRPAPTRQVNQQRDVRDSDNQPRGRDAYLQRLRGGRDFGRDQNGAR